MPGGKDEPEVALAGARLQVQGVAAPHSREGDPEVDLRVLSVHVHA